MTAATTKVQVNETPSQQWLWTNFHCYYCKHLRVKLCYAFCHGLL